jgi:hypothetical protein
MHIPANPSLLNGGRRRLLILALLVGLLHAETTYRPEDKDDAHHVTQTLSTISAFLSACGSVYIIHSYWKSVQNFKEAGGHDRPTFSNKLVLIISFMDLICSFNFGVGQGWQRVGAGACDFQGFMVQMGVCTVFWNCCMAHHLYHWVVLREHETKRRARLNKYLLGSLGSAFFLACLYPAATNTHYYDEGVLWCWVAEFPWQLGIFYIWVLLGWVYNGAVFFLVRREIRRRAVQAGSEEAQKSVQTVLMRTSLYLGAFVFIWFFGLLNRIVSYSEGAPNEGTSALHAMFVPLQGFLNSVVYGGLWERFSLYCEREVVGELVHRARSVSMGSASTRGPRSVSWHSARGGGATKRRSEGGGVLQSEPSFTPKFKKAPQRSFALFASTWNMGECDVPTNLHQWLPKGKDLYVIGLQECMHMEEMRAAIVAHLNSARTDGSNGSNGSNGWTPSNGKRHSKDEYVVAKGGGRSIGSTATTLGFHGHIALTLFVRASLERSGVFEVPDLCTKKAEVTRGKNLGVMRAANKGAVGVPCRLGSSTLAFVTCHLASDSKGKSKLGNRNTDAQEILQSLSLTVDEEGYDLPHMQHHTVFMGDVNYRNTVHDATPDQILQLVTLAMGRQRQRVALEELLKERKTGAAGMTRADLAKVLPPQPAVHVAKRGEWSKAGILDRNESTEVGDLMAGGVTAAEKGGAWEGEGEGEERAAEQKGAEERGAEGGVTVGKEAVVMNPLMQQADSGSGVDSGSGIKSASGVEDGSELSVGSGSGSSSGSSSSSDSQVDGSPAPRSTKFFRVEKGSAVKGSAVSSKEVVSLVVALQEAKAAEEEAWSRVLAHDELLKCMHNNQVFAGFSEEAIRFPPSYRRMRGLEGDCGDYCDQTVLEGAYSTAVKGAGARVPSYTDRILLHSLTDLQHKIKCSRGPAVDGSTGSKQHGYYICNALVGSDHRPVCVEYSLTTALHSHQQLAWEHSVSLGLGRDLSMASELSAGSNGSSFDSTRTSSSSSSSSGSSSGSGSGAMKMRSKSLTESGGSTLDHTTLGDPPAPPQVFSPPARPKPGKSWSSKLLKPGLLKQPSRLAKAPLEYRVTLTKLEVEWEEEVVPEQEQPEEVDGEASGKKSAVSRVSSSGSISSQGSRSSLKSPDKSPEKHKTSDSKHEPMKRRASDVGSRLRAMTASLSNSERGYADQHEGLSITAQFPLPSEDIFGAQRKMHLIQDEMMVSIATSASGKKQAGAKNRADSVWGRNIVKENWDSVRSGEVEELACVAQGREIQGLHMLVKLERGTRRQGEGVVVLQEAAAALGTSARFITALVSGGRRTGVITGEVTVHCKKGRTGNAA